MIVTTREQRRQLERDNAKLPVHLVPVPEREWPGGFQGEDRPRRVWRSRGFLVQEFFAPPPARARLSILRTTLDPKVGRWVDGITWDELQRLKTECGYGDFDAVEVYPCNRDIVNVANLRHLWVLDEKLTFAWRKK